MSAKVRCECVGMTTHTGSAVTASAPTCLVRSACGRLLWTVCARAQRQPGCHGNCGPPHHGGCGARAHQSSGRSQRRRHTGGPMSSCAECTNLSGISTPLTVAASFQSSSVSLCRAGGADVQQPVRRQEEPSSHADAEVLTPPAGHVSPLPGPNPARLLLQEV